MVSRFRVYARLMARRPNDEWQQQVDEQAAALAEGSLTPDDAYASRLWPESLRVGTDAALATFEHELRALKWVAPLVRRGCQAASGSGSS
jgi:hypothetical protein